jgi:hypothetical protein
MGTTFATPALERKPDQICVGRVTEVGDAYESKSGKYYVVRITVEPMDAGKGTKIYFLFRPEWMAQLSQVDLLNIKEADKGAHFVYGKNIATNEEGKQSTLQGLAVTTEDFNTLASRLIALGVEAVSENPTLVSDVLRTFLLDENGDRNIGYVLTQQTEKTDEVHPETGKAIYVPTKNWEVASYFAVNDKNIARMAKKAESRPDRFRMTFAGAAF